MKKRALSLLMAFVMVLSLLPATARAAGTGAVDDPIEISNEAELKDFRDKVNEGGTTLCAKLTANITLIDEWTPISNTSAIASAYSGTFDGDKHTISGLSGSNGLFGFVNGATIKNLKVEGTISGSTTGIGGIVGITQGLVRIENCVFSGKISANYTDTRKSNGIGGIVGRVNNGTLIISNCMNIGDVQATGTCDRNGVIRVGGVLGLSAKSGTKIESCYSSGTISGNTCGGITGALTNRGSKIENCCWTQPDKGNGIGGGSLSDNSSKVTSATDALAILGDAFQVVDGEVVLAWEAGGTPAEKNPRIVISGGSTLQMTNSGEKPRTTLTVEYKDMEGSTPTVTWSTSNDCVILTAPNNASAADNIRIAQANKPGTVTITATVDDETIEPATFDIDVLPFVSGLNYTNTATGGNEPVIGQEVRVDVVTIGNKIFSSDKLSFAWWNNTTNTPIAKTTENTFVIPDSPDSFNEWNNLGVDVFYNGATIHSHADHQQYVRSAEYGKAYVVAQDIALPTDITEETVLTLPAVYTKDGETVNIEWSSKDIAITDNTVKLTLPESGKKTIKLSAKCTLADTDTAANRTFTVYVWSTSGADENTLNEAASKLENMGALHPRFGEDSNVQTMVETRLAKEFPDVGVMYTGKTPMSATENEAHSDISDNGNVTYFYTDLTTTDLTTTLQRFDTYKASFTLTCGKETKSVEISVIVYWDADKVRDFMTKEVLDQTTLPEQTKEALMLPTSGKWTTISWTSSDPTIIANDGTITRSTIDQQAVLTATFTFNFTNNTIGREPSIVLYKTFEVTVKGNADAADRAALYQQKLNDALAAPGLKDFVTGEKLTADANGVYTTSNDIQFPTTRDLKIDGKYTPVVITSSDPGVIEAPTTPNSARVWVYRPLPGEAAKTVTLTMKILDRPNGSGRDYANLPVLTEKSVTVSVRPLTQAEIDAEIVLMAKAKAKDAYWDGIRNANTDQNNVTTDLHAFQECYLDTDGSLTWVYDREDLKNHGIVPVPLDNWYDQQIWRLFRSSNADVVAHENLLVTRQGDSKAVTITSYLSSETLGRYAEKYPQNADFQKLYKQPVTVDLVVTGTQYAQGNNEGRVQAAKRALAVRPTVTVSFSLSGRGMGFPEESNLEYAEGSTVYDVFSDLLVKHGYTCKRRGSYIAAITSDSGVTLEEFDEGKNSGWMYRVNGELVGRYMSAQGLKDGDRIELYFTSDWTSEPGAEGWQKPGKIETIVNADGSVTKIETKSDGTVIETTTWRDGSTLTAETSPNGRVETVEKRADGTTVETVESASGGITASVSVPKSVGSTRVDIPVSKPTGSMVAVIVHPDGTEEIVRGSVVTETGVALRAEGDVRLKIIDNAKRFNDMADHWAKDAVEFASSRELFNGVGNDAFGPDRSMTRGMVSTVLARLAGADTAGGETWYAKGTVWAVENGISDGTAPEQPVTREQLAAMLYRYAGSPAVSGELSFDDTTVISIWAYDAVRWCVDNGILNGVGGNRMAPQDLARRGQVAAMLMRFLQATV